MLKPSSSAGSSPATGITEHVAQWIEHPTSNRTVAGSNPAVFASLTREELIGHRFCKLVLLRPAGPRGKSTWWCRCDCGARCYARLIDLLRGNKKSCGCGFRGGCRTNLTGRRFGRLTVLRLDPRDIGRGQRRWVVRCDCGNEPAVAAKALVSGTTRSCGCLRIETGKALAGAASRGPDGRFATEAAA